MEPSGAADDFHSAIREDNRDFLEKALNSGTDINCFYYGMTPLHVAITKGHVELAIWLIGKGADVNKSEINAKTTLFEEAVIRDQVQVVKALGKKGIDFDQMLSNGERAITFAALNQHTYLCQTLIEGRASASLRNSQNETAIWLSAREGFTGVVELLVKTKLALDTACGPDALTPLLSSVVNEHLSTTLILIKAGCNLDTPDSSGWTPLWHAVSNSNEALVRALVKAGANINIPDSTGKTLIEEAMENEDEDILVLLKGSKR